MRPHPHITILLRQAHDERRCATVTNHADRMAMLRRRAEGSIISPYPGLYIDTEYWSSLNPTQQTLHIARALATLHPDWVFAGPTAAAFLGLEHQWTIHRSGLYIADRRNGSSPPAPAQPPRSPNAPRATINRIYMSSVPVIGCGDVTVTSPARTLIDCVELLQFRHTLPLFDSAFAASLATADDIRTMCRGLRRDRTPVDRMLQYVNPLHDNGGESFAYGTMAEEGLALPVVQHTFQHPNKPGVRYRADFTWFLSGGRIVVAEYDGMAKYVDPSMTDRRTIEAVVAKQSARERDLFEMGVGHIERLTYDDVVRRQPMVEKLLRAGIPRYGRPW